MFSKEILKSDLASLEILKNQRENCKKILIASFRDLIISDPPSVTYVEEEKSALLAMQDQLLDLEQQINILEHQMFLNYTNRYAITHSAPLPPGSTFPHLDTIKT